MWYLKINTLVLFLLAGLQTSGQNPIHYWNFDRLGNQKVTEMVAGTMDPILGYTDSVRGVLSGAIQFDGYTGCMVREKSNIELPGEFTVIAWIRLESYPWFRCPVFDLRAGEKEGLLFGVDRWGKLCAGMGLPGTWKEFSGNQLPLKQWVMVGLTVKQKGVSKLWMDGTEVGELAETPVIRSTGNNRLSVGRNAFLEEWWDFQYTVKDHYSFLDGSLDELKIYPAALSGNELTSIFKSIPEVPNHPSTPRVLPSGPAGQADFGAVYTRLNYTRQWDRLWRSGEFSDVLVRFGVNPVRLVFWRGTSFVPCWVTENNIWYTNEWTETWGNDVTSCAEPLMDRKCLYSHVRIIENTPARIVVQWRYALSDADYQIAAQKQDGWGEWTEEFFIMYPDGIGIRKIDLYYSKPIRNHDWEESIVLLSPGQHPDEVIEDPEITLLNMKGESRDYSWRQNLPVEMKEPKGANIHLVNLKSKFKPFYIVSPEPFESKEGKYDYPFFRSYAASMADYWRPDTVPSIYGWWNHWPVALVPGDGRWVEHNDQPSHFNLTTYTQWKDYYMDDKVKSRIMLHGMTAGGQEELVSLAKSWLTPPRLLLNSIEISYDQSQRAYVYKGLFNNILEGAFEADDNHPAFHPALIIENARVEHPSVEINGKILKEGQQYTTGIVMTDKGYNTIIWIRQILRKKSGIRIQSNP